MFVYIINLERVTIFLINIFHTQYWTVYMTAKCSSHKWHCNCKLSEYYKDYYSTLEENSNYSVNEYICMYMHLIYTWLNNTEIPMRQHKNRCRTGHTHKYVRPVAIETVATASETTRHQSVAWQPGFLTENLPHSTSRPQGNTAQQTNINSMLIIAKGLQSKVYSVDLSFITLQYRYLWNRKY